MGVRNPQLNWDRLLDGQTYTLNLDTIGWRRGLNDLRAKVHYEVDRRRGVAHTHKVDAATLELYAEGARVQRPLQPCTCGAQPWDLHVITCAALGANAATAVGSRPPVQDVWTQPQEPPPTPTFQAEEPDDEALLGPCTCGQAPTCGPGCARVTGAAV